jgi:PKD repeat protein
MVVYDEWDIDNPLNRPVPVNASFSVDRTSGPVPLTVQFTNQSTGDITEYAWDFGDGSTSTAKDPGDHTFNGSGIYNVTLTVSGPDGSNAQQTTSITVDAPPVAIFSAYPTEGQQPLPVGFTNQSTGNITSYFWTFGYGSNSSSDRNPSHTFRDSGTYTVTLTVIGPGGSSTSTTSITVTPIIR